MSKTVNVMYNPDTLETSITVDGNAFDTSRINGKEISDWAYPFMMRKVKWNGFYDEMVEALGGEKEFSLVYEGPESGLEELKEAWEDAPVTIVENKAAENTVIIEYSSDPVSTTITVNGQPFDTSRIDGKEIEDWVFPFMMRKIKWDGIFSEISNVIGSDEYTIQFTGSSDAMKILMEDCPETVTVNMAKKKNGLNLKKNDSNDDSNDDIPQEAVDLEDKAYQLYDKGKYEEAFKMRLQAADMGNVISISNLGCHYQYGNGVEQNYEKALEYYLKASDMGSDFATNKVGFMYNNGYGCDEDEEMAFSYFMKAAENNYPESMYWVGMCYKNGWGVNQDYVKALEWMEKASDAGEVDGAKEAGLFYYNGLGCEKDESTAETYWLIAGDAESNYYLSDYCYSKNDYSGAFSFAKSAYEAGYTKAASDLAVYYENGQGTQKDCRMAARILEENVDEFPELYVQLGKLYFHIMNENHNDAMAARCFQKAVDHEFVEGYYMLGLCYSDGRGVPKDTEKAKMLLQVAMDNGHEEAANAYNNMIKTEGYIETAKKIGGALLKNFFS